MAKPELRLGKFFIVVSIVVVALVALALWARFLVSARAEVDKYLFTTDISNITRNSNLLGTTERLSFILSPVPYSLGEIVKLYAKTAESNGWQVTSGRGPTYQGPSGPAFSEQEHVIEISKNGQHLVIKLERMLEKTKNDKVLITIIYDK